jgi:hypothetical protein
MSIESIRQEIYDTANSVKGGLHRNEAIFRTISGIIADAGFLTNPQYSPIRFKVGRNNFAIDGYDIDEDDGVMTLLAVVDAHASTELDRPWTDVICPKKDLDAAIKMMLGAIEALTEGEDPELDESDPAHDLIRSLRTEYRFEKKRVTCCVLTTGSVSNQGASTVSETSIRTAMWDADRLIRTRKNGREQLVANFEQIGNGLGLPCLVSEHEANEIQEGRIGVLITKVPGQFLASLYEEYRMRLMERNVRAFLQFTGKVNKGIRETIRTEPEHFLSFNNGISVTASKVTLRKSSEGNYHLLSADDFQIVNGGQTTASIARCVREDKADVSAIGVAMKLTVVPESLIDELVPRISRYANTQNKIQETDFFANNPWHIEMERHSRDIEADRDADSEGQPIRWYYERVRGQYAEELAKLSTAPQKNRFKERNPSRTKFTKTDLSRYLLSWEQEAHSVSLGGQKCFARLMSVLGATTTTADASQLPGAEDFKRVCCLAILQRKGERISTELGIVGYRANLVAYAIAVLSKHTEKKLPWRKVWSLQDIPPEIDQALRIAIPACDKAIRDSAAARNISEWAKRSECREYVLSKKIELSLTPNTEWDHFSIKDMARPKGEVELIRVFKKLSAEQWSRLAGIARYNGDRPIWANVCETMATRLIPLDRTPSDKQTSILRKVLAKHSKHLAVRDTLTEEDRKIIGG